MSQNCQNFPALRAGGKLRLKFLWGGGAKKRGDFLRPEQGTLGIRKVIIRASATPECMLTDTSCSHAKWVWQNMKNSDLSLS